LDARRYLRAHGAEAGEKEGKEVKKLRAMVRSAIARLFGRQKVGTPKIRKTAPLLEELEIFGNEQDSAQRYFFGYLSMHRIPAANPEVLRRMNDDSTFWITTRNALLTSTFVVLGRIFDQDQKSVHNIDKLLGAATNEIGSLNRTGLAQRRVAERVMTQPDADKYASDRHDLTYADIRQMRKAVDKWRKVYVARYRDIRHKIFAHKGASSVEAEALMAKTNVDEIKQLLGFLHALHNSLDQLYRNGLVPDLTPATFDLPPTPSRSKSAEILYRESGNVLYGLVDP
jgi:AbiU2